MMWGLDSHGLRVLTDDEEAAIRDTGACTFAAPEFTLFDLIVAVWPFKENERDKDGKPVPHSRGSIRKLAQQGGLKWGPFKIDPSELFETQETNQDFCVISMGKRKREMIFFKEEA